MKLTDEQKQQVALWVNEGLSMGQIQKNLADAFAINVTYMEVRFLVDDLDLTVPAPPEPEPEPDDAEAETDGEPATAAEDSETPVATGEVSVEVDRVTRPGSMISGNITFSDGMDAEWYIDQMGRPGLVAKQEGYRPSDEDIMTFQTKLEEILKTQGF